MLKKLRKAQGVTEYAIFIAAVLAGLLALQVYYQRAVKGNVKARADSIGEAFSANSTYNHETRSVAARNSWTGYQPGNTSWSKSDILSGNVKSLPGRDEKGQVISGSDLSAQVKAITTSHSVGAVALVDGYAGGEVTSSDYVDSSGAHSTSGLGNITNNVTVWQDAQMQ